MQTSTNSNRWRERFTAFAPLFIWIGVIFFLSNANGSMSETSRFIGPFLKFLLPAASDETLLTCHKAIRKLAHLTEYAILGVLACRAFLSSRSKFLSAKYWIAAVLLVAAVAGLDEINQSFDVLRTASPYDVMLDVLGGTIAVVLVILWRRRHSPGVS